MTTPRPPLCEILGIEYVVIQAPMTGATTVDLPGRRLPAGERVRALVEEACDGIERLRRWTMR